MNYYKDSDGNVFAFESSDVIPSGLSAITSSQIASTLASKNSRPEKIVERADKEHKNKLANAKQQAIDELIATRVAEIMAL